MKSSLIVMKGDTFWFTDFEKSIDFEELEEK
jgi:hypothetical protein